MKNSKRLIIFLFALLFAFSLVLGQGASIRAKAWTEEQQKMIDEDYKSIAKPGQVKNLKVSQLVYNQDNKAKFKFTWKKVKCTGYIIEFSNSKKFSKVTRFSTKSNSLPYHYLTRGKTWYVRVVAYNSEKWAATPNKYGKYSKVVKFKAK
ncbi:MAG: fibronectin type III domain-containing protein [Butyrivibrio sp.]|nr:fibronectin type III domain-containing protein [Butyrivibrio sp.]